MKKSLITEKNTILFLFDSLTGIGHQQWVKMIAEDLLNAGYAPLIASGSFMRLKNYFSPDIDLLELNDAFLKSDEGYFVKGSENSLELKRHFDHNAWLWWMQKLLL